MVMEFTDMVMAMFTKVNGKRIRSKEKDNFHMQMETVMLENSQKEENRVMVFTNGQMETYMKVILPET